MLLDAGWRGDEDEDCFLRAGDGGRWEMARFGLVRRESVPGMGGSGVGAVEKGKGGEWVVGGQRCGEAKGEARNYLRMAPAKSNVKEALLLL